MKPIGLTRKRATGEIMIVHQCLTCGKISPNRIAGDDNPYEVISLLRESGYIGGIIMLTTEDKDEVGIVLFGNGYRT